MIVTSNLNCNAGGFAAPIMISTGQGNHIALFSYYALLNAGILAQLQEYCSSSCEGKDLSSYLATVMEGPSTWDGDRTIGPAIEIRGGVVQNPKILSFQGRSADYPHPHL